MTLRVNLPVVPLQNLLSSFLLLLPFRPVQVLLQLEERLKVEKASSRVVEPFRLMNCMYQVNLRYRRRWGVIEYQDLTGYTHLDVKHKLFCLFMFLQFLIKKEFGVEW